MTREIKFRAWDKDQKEMWYDIQDKTVQISKRSEIIKILKKEFVTMMEFWRVGHPDRFKIMQYIGVKDMNGKKVYEGDVVKYYESKRIGHPYKDFIGEIVWEDLTYQIRDVSGLVRYKRLELSQYLEVLGNIYENSDLLKLT